MRGSLFKELGLSGSWVVHCVNDIEGLDKDDGMVTSGGRPTAGRL